MTAYYNEIDPGCCEWLEALIDAGIIAPGDVDNRDIRDVTVEDLSEYTQVHLFAGIGVWSYALTRCGWPDDCPVWTFSCPCQPFSVAGKKKGFDDDRHLWPEVLRLLEARPFIPSFGEQVAGKDGTAWIDVVQSDLERKGYTVGKCSTVACGFGAPNKRQRMYFVADPPSSRCESWSGSRNCESTEQRGYEPPNSNVTRILADTDDAGSQGRSLLQECADQFSAGPGGVVGRMADSCGIGREWWQRRQERCLDYGTSARWTPGHHGSIATHETGDGHGDPGPTNGFWRDTDWLLCSDARWRPVEPGTQPLVDGATERVRRIRAAGNAINAEQAIAFINSYLEVKAEDALL